VRKPHRKAQFLRFAFSWCNARMGDFGSLSAERPNETETTRICLGPLIPLNALANNDFLPFVSNVDGFRTLTQRANNPTSCSRRNLAEGLSD